mgnify:FL=1
MKDSLLIIGASGHGKVVADVAIKMGKWKEIFFLDDNPKVKNSMGIDVIDDSKSLSKYIEHYDIFVGIGNNKIRKITHKKLQAEGASIPVLVHPSAIIGKDVQIECGTVVMAGAVINSSTKIGEGCIINTGSTVDHDNEICDYVHISPGVNLAGTVIIGECSWIGIGSVISNNVKVTKQTIIGAGGLVLKDIIESGTYVGVPVRRIR